MDKSVYSIVSGLREINENTIDLEGMEKQVCSIVTGLREIDEAETDQLINDEIAG
jgi:hypothetical protein